MPCSQEGLQPRTCMGIVDEAGRLERAGRPVIHLEKGELDLDTPDVVKESAVRALRDNKTRYSDSSGLPELRQAISDHFRRQYEVAVDPGQVIVYPGSSAAMLELFLALLSPGDEVVLPSPGYPAYPSFVQAARGEVVFADATRHGFVHTADLVRPHLTDSTRAVLINFPSNPVGTTLGADGLCAFADLGRLIVSDEVYHGLAFREERPHSILEFTDEAVVVGSFSKSFAMTGWRLGYLVVPAWLRGRLVRMHQSLFVGTSTFTQWAAITALENAAAIQRQIRAELLRRHDRLVTELPRVGIEPAYPSEGGFYLFARQPTDTGTSAQFAARLLDRTYVAITPGSEFGPTGEGFIRFSLSAPGQQIGDAMDRIAHFLGSGAGEVAAAEPVRGAGLRTAAGAGRMD
jgi:aspartate/methionine/tyrosine aminotransferase